MIPTTKSVKFILWTNLFMTIGQMLYVIVTSVAESTPASAASVAGPVVTLTIAICAFPLWLNWHAIGKLNRLRETALRLAGSI